MRRVFKTRFLFVPGFILVMILAACSAAATPTPMPVVNAEPVATPISSVPVVVATPIPVPTAKALFEGRTSGTIE